MVIARFSAIVSLFLLEYVPVSSSARRQRHAPRIPLFRVWKEHRDDPWPRLLDFWGLPNLQMINRDVHAEKCAIEARDRRGNGSDVHSIDTPLALIGTDHFSISLPTKCLR